MRQRKPSRLYLARSSDRAPNWVIRDGRQTIRTGALEHEAEKAQNALHLHMIGTGELAGISSEINYTRNPVSAVPTAIYFITCDAPDFPIKIGIASNVERRIAGLQNALPYEVLLLGSFPGSYLDEGHLHQRFKEHHLRGEWFRRHPAILALCDEGLADCKLFDKAMRDAGVSP